MSIRKISEFVEASSPQDSDKLLIERNGSGKSITVKNLLDEFYNIPRRVPKDITPYWADGTLWNRIAGTGGYKIYDDIHVGDYIDMGRPVTCPNSPTTGSQYVVVASCGGLEGAGGYDSSAEITYNHIVMIPGQGFGGTQHFGKHAMHSSSQHPGYAKSDMNKLVIGPAVTEGSIATGATINQQLYYIFGSHLKTYKSMLATGVNPSLYNRSGLATGASSAYDWALVQARLMSEAEVYGSTAWSSSGYDTGDAYRQLELFQHRRSAVNDRDSSYWLKDTFSSNGFCICSWVGHADTSLADEVTGVRPCFILA